MTTVIQLLDHAIRAASEAGKLKEAIPSLLIKARGRIQFLEKQVSEVETLRDRFAMQLLPSIMAANSVMDTDDRMALAYHRAEKLLAIRLQGSAGAPGETTPPEISENGHTFWPGDRVRVKATGVEGFVVAADTHGIVDYSGPKYTAVSFRGYGVEPGTVCLTEDLALVGKK